MSVAAATGGLGRFPLMLMTAAACTCGGTQLEEPTAEPVAIRPSAPPPTSANDVPTRQTELERLDDDASLAPLRDLAVRCDNDHHIACWLLGDAYERGEAALDPSEPDARRLYRKACRTGGVGCADAARVHTAAAHQHLERGCQRGDAQACEAWAASRPDSAAEARRLGCGAGWLAGCSDDDEAIEECEGPISQCIASSRRQRGAKALRMALRACNGELTAGCIRYGELSTDDGAKRVAFERACVAGLAEGCRKLLSLLEPGESGREEFERRLCALDGTDCPQ